MANRNYRIPATRRHKPHIGWMLFGTLLKLSMFQTIVFYLFRRLESYLARTARLEAKPFGNTLMLLMKPQTAQVESP
jgi:hypothetical protein